MESRCKHGAEEDTADGLDDGWDEADAPDITLLTADEVEDILTLRPTPEQLRYFTGDYTTIFQRWGGALLLTVVAHNYVLVAAGAVTFPLWLPILQATNKNRIVRQRYRHVGLWRAEVLEVDIVQRPQARFTERTVRGRKSRFPGEPFVRLLVGDQSGARTEVIVPYERRHEQMRVGEPAELMVLAEQRSFARFKALKEVYLPESGVWLASYPYIMRGRFLEISLDIERERQAAMAVDVPP
ncbi:hypothetical protein WJX72_006741 [[Myrmecia] bisecta]|uniref:Uncharacterized protein n=1 Tax=[Myrmecia] bisecta TaxID=41462 RepID=A0AAW1QFN6_9CHLO